MADPTGSTQPDVASNGHPQPAVGAGPQARAPKGIWERLKQHKVAQWTLAYAAAGYTLLHAVEMLSEAQEWPHAIARVLSLVLILGIPVVITLAWYHGARHAHRVSGPELTIITILLVLMGSVLWALTRTGARAPAQLREAATPAASVAVVPFANLTGEPGKEYFSDGMAEELINELTLVPGLKVPARTSSFAYKGRNIDIRQIARDLGVASILEGSVRSAGDQIRVTAQLVNAQTGYHYWSRTYDRDFGNVFKLEDEISAQIVEALKSSMNAQLPAAVTRAPPTTDPDAYRLYLQGISIADPQGGMRLLTEAIARDPRFARAYAGRGERIITGATLGQIEARIALSDGARDVNTALTLDPNLAEAHALLATLNAWRGDWSGAAAQYDRAQQLAPGEPGTYAYRAIYVLAAAGHMRQAVQTMLTSYSLAPASPPVVTTLGAFYDLSGNSVEAVRYNNLAVALAGNGSGYGFADPIKRDAALRSGHYEEAAELALAGESPDMSAVVKQAYAALGRPEERPAASHALRALLQKRWVTDSREASEATHRITAMLSATMLGDLDLAYDSANWYVDQYAREGIVGTNWGDLWMPEMRPFRRDPRFQAFVARLKLPDYWKEYGPPDECDLKDGKLTCR